MYKPVAGKQSEADAGYSVRLAVNTKENDDSMQGDRNNDCFEHQRNRSGYVEVRGVLYVGLPGDRESQHQGMECEDVEERVESILVKLKKAHEHKGAGEHVSDIENKAAHLEAP